MASHFETLLIEYYEWRGFLVRHNQKVGKLPKGGWEMELDVIAYDPSNNVIFHLEPSLDGDSWEKREMRFKKKFEAGRKHIAQQVFPWIPVETTIEQIAILVQAGPNRRNLAGASVKTVDEMIAEIRNSVKNTGLVSKAAIPEQYPLLRTIQFVVSGYYKLVEKTDDSVSKISC